MLDYDSDQNTAEVTRSYYHRNALGSVMEITDANEATVVSYRYDPYGTVMITRGGQTQSTDPLGQHWTSTSRFLDEETGLHYYRARYYDASLGPFLQRDPLGYFPGPSLYQYASSRPTTPTDPLGLIETEEQIFNLIGGPAIKVYVNVSECEVELVGYEFHNLPQPILRVKNNSEYHEPLALLRDTQGSAMSCRAVQGVPTVPRQGLSGWCPAPWGEDEDIMRRWRLAETKDGIRWEVDERPVLIEYEWRCPGGKKCRKARMQVRCVWTDSDDDDDHGHDGFTFSKVFSAKRCCCGD